MRFFHRHLVRRAGCFFQFRFDRFVPIAEIARKGLFFGKFFKLHHSLVERREGCLARDGR